jgi:hypothetical protein
MEDQSTQASPEVKNEQNELLRSQLPPFNPVLTTSIILGVIGWIGLIVLVVFTVPTLGPRWLMYFLVTLAFSGPALSAMHYLHKRFPAKPVANNAVLVREALWVGIYADVMLWLQFGKALNFAIAAFSAIGLFAVEMLLRWRERNKWTPPADREESKEAAENTKTGMTQENPLSQDDFTKFDEPQDEKQPEISHDDEQS